MSIPSLKTANLLGGAWRGRWHDGEPDCEVYDEISRAHDPASARGVRGNDPAFGIRWPAPPSVILQRDTAYSDVATRRGTGIR